MIDEEQQALRSLADELRLRQVRILSGGFSYARADSNGTVRLVARSAANGWERLAHELHDLSQRYRWAERRWDSPVSRPTSRRRSVAEWLDDVNARHGTAARPRRVFADSFSPIPTSSRCCARRPVLAHDDDLRENKMYQHRRWQRPPAVALAADLGERLHLNTELLAVSQRGGTIRASLRNGRARSQLQTDYLVFALPASAASSRADHPGAPGAAARGDRVAELRPRHEDAAPVQHALLASRHRPAARVRLDAADRRSWEANEDQRGKAGILSLLAGGSASDETAELLERDGVNGLVRRLDWLGSRDAQLLAWRQARWESDPWSRGGYAVFDAAFKPVSCVAGSPSRASACSSPASTPACAGRAT